MAESTLIGPLRESRGNKVAAKRRHEIMEEAGLLDPDQPTEHTFNLDRERRGKTCPTCGQFEAQGAAR